MRIKALIFLISIAVTPAVASADCALTWMRSLHDTTTPMGWLVLHGGGEAEPYLAGLQDQRVTLVSGRERVPARVIAFQRGQLNVVQTILQPEAPLKVGRTYRLTSDRGHGVSRGLRYGLQRLAWKVEAASGEPVAWQAAPAAAGGQRVPFGCGPAVNIQVDVPLNRPVRGVWATVRPADDSAPPLKWFFAVHAGRIRVGHGCARGPRRSAKGSAMSSTSWRRCLWRGRASAPRAAPVWSP